MEKKIMVKTLGIGALCIVFVIVMVYQFHSATLDGFSDGYGVGYDDGYKDGQQSATHAQRSPVGWIYIANIPDDLLKDIDFTMFTEKGVRIRIGNVDNYIGAFPMIPDSNGQYGQMLSPEAEYEYTLIYKNEVLKHGYLQMEANTTFNDPFILDLNKMVNQALNPKKIVYNIEWKTMGD